MFNRKALLAGIGAMLLIGVVVVAASMWNRAGTATPDGSPAADQDAAAYFAQLGVSTALPAAESRQVGGVEWFLAFEDEAAALWFDPRQGRMAVEDKRSGKRWASNPSQEALASVATAGLWRTHLESPILFKYLHFDKKLVIDSNLLEETAVVQWKAIDQGVGIQYSMEALGFQFYIEYQLEDGQLVASIPKLGILETKQHLLMELHVLPFMGAATDEEEGYLLVPDGPGGLIHFHKTALEMINAYDFPVYGVDHAITSNAGNAVSAKRTPISYPVFGMKAAGGGWLGIIEEGAAIANIVATPAGIVTPFHEAHAKIVLRHLYTQPTGLSSSVLSYTKPLPREPISIRYLFLAPEASDYVGMAHAYRSYLIKHRQLAMPASAPAAAPLQLRFVIGASEASPLGDKLLVATTFAQVEQMVAQLEARGVTNVEVGLTGWQHGGDPGYLPNRFPIEAAAGGEARLRELLAKLSGRGIPAILSDQADTAAASRRSSFNPAKDGVQAITGLPLKYLNADGQAEYAISQQRNLAAYLPAAAAKWQQLGVGSVALNNLGSRLNSDFHPSRAASRTDAIGNTLAMLQTVEEAVGGVRVYGGFDYLLGQVDFMYDFPLEYNYDLLVDEQVPFYPIAVHGLVPYSSGTANLRDDPVVQFLRDIEYGAVPQFTLTYKDPRLLKQTIYADLFSSQFEVLEEQIVAEYQALAEAGVQNSFIAGHRKLAEGVYETVYENGKRVRVNYNLSPYAGPGYEIGPLNYQVAEERGG